MNIYCILYIGKLEQIAIQKNTKLFLKAFGSRGFPADRKAFAAIDITFITN